MGDRPPQRGPGRRGGPVGAERLRLQPPSRVRAELARHGVPCACIVRVLAAAGWVCLKTHGGRRKAVMHYLVLALTDLASVVGRFLFFVIF